MSRKNLWWYVHFYTGKTVNVQLASRESPMGKNVEKVHEASTNKDGVRLATL